MVTQEDENVQNQGALDSPCFSHHSDLDVLSTSALDSFFRDHGNALAVTAQP